MIIRGHDDNSEADVCCLFLKLGNDRSSHVRLLVQDDGDEIDPFQEPRDSFPRTLIMPVNYEDAALSRLLGSRLFD